MPCPPSPRHARKYSVGALLVNRPAGRFILRFGGAESKGCAPARHGVSISADMVVGVAPIAVIPRPRTRERNLLNPKRVENYKRSIEPNRPYPRLCPR